MKRTALTLIFIASIALLIRLSLMAFAADLPPETPVNAPASPAPASPSSVNTRPIGFGSSRLAPLPGGGISDRALPLPREYSILISRSMFVRGHVAEAGHIGEHITAPSSSPTPAREELSLVFNGVTRTSTTIDALVEDTNTGRVLTVHSGDAVAKGTVGKITMDTLEYVSAAGTTTVQIGQNFAGNQADLSAVPTTNTPAGSGASPQDILERLRLKRLQELGGH